MPTVKRPWAYCWLLSACAEVLPPDLGGQPFWAPIDRSAGPDLGHSPQLGTGPAAGWIRMVDRTEAAGLAPVVGHGNTHGVGVALVDLNQDGYPDLFVANGRRVDTTRFRASAYYLNRGDGTFEDFTGPGGISALGELDLYSVAAGDYDRDGDLDLYLGAQPTDRLLRNEGGRFEDVTTLALAGGPASNPALVSDGKSKIVSFGDYDGDGWLDLVSASKTLPEPYAYLLRNKGDGTFEDVSVATGVFAHAAGNPCAVLFSDYDNDGDQDLWIWNDRGSKVLLKNQQARWVDVTTSAGLDRVSITHPMGIDSADLDHDGDLDTYVTNIGNNPLLRNNGDGTFVDLTESAGTGGETGWGVAFEDLDLDGWADLFVAQEDHLPHLVFHNLRSTDGPRFDRIEVDHPDVLDDNAAHNVAAAFADYDRDGLTDVVVATTDGSRIGLFRNETDRGGHHFLEVVIPRGPGGDRGGISARIGVRTGELLQFRDLTSGSSRGSQNEVSVRFGLGLWDGADQVIAQWPDGTTWSVRNVAGDQRLELSPP
jgi:hypothetical protein